MQIVEKSIYIPSIDAKDLWLSNHYNSPSPLGYNIRNYEGDISTKKFINTLDYSLELIKLREIYEKVYRRMNFSFYVGDKEYTQRVINVTFKYSVKEYNRVRNNIYVKNGTNYKDIADKIKDCSYCQDGELIAIVVDTPVKSPLVQDLLGKYFWFEGGVYKAKTNIGTVVDVAQLRTRLYEDGFYCDGIKYVRFKRSSGSSRVGKCLFIDEKLYNQIHKWELCHLKIQDKQEVDLAALESYIALTLSSIIDTIEINAENILIIDDYTSVFTDKVISTSVDKDGWLVSKPETVELHNSIWDGQSLLDSSMFGKYNSYGMLLLRNRFFKSCCFNTDIQKFFVDNGINEIGQLNGFTLAKDIHDIKLITTPSSIKYLKFGSLEDWLTYLEPLFGIVKHEKKTHFFDGRMVQTHYQLLNTLRLTYREVEEFLKPSLDYLYMLKTEPAVFRYHIKYPGGDNYHLPMTSLESKNDIVYRLLGINDRFTKTKLYADYRTDLTNAFVKNLKCGHVLVNGNYSTLCGNPLEMLFHSIGKFHGESMVKAGTVHSTRFSDGSTLLGSRSPHVCMGNILVTQNKLNHEITRYFHATDEIVYINSIGENILNRLSGSDFDSDTLLLTDDKILIDAAKRNYHRFLVPTNNVPSVKVQRTYTNRQKADLDIKTSVNKIGEIINLSQELNSLFWNYLNQGIPFDELMPLYCDIAQLDVMSGIEIDKAKKEYSIDNVLELKKIKKKYCRSDKTGKQIKPKFFEHISKLKGYYNPDKKKYKAHETTMDYLQKIINKKKKSPNNSKYEPFISIVNPACFDKRKVNYSQVKQVIDIIRETKKSIYKIWACDDLEKSEKSYITNELRQECTNYIDKLKFNYSTMYWLLKSIELPANEDIRRSVFNTLFGAPNQAFFKLLAQSKEPIAVLKPDDTGNISIFGMKFSA